MQVSPKRIAILVFRAFLGLFAIGAISFLLLSWSAQRDIAALKTSLNTSQEPISFMANAIKPGMSRQEVHVLVRGYYRYKILEPDTSEEGPTDFYHFSWGVTKMFESMFLEAGTIMVEYGPDGRVLEATPTFN